MVAGQPKVTDKALAPTDDYWLWKYDSWVLVQEYRRLFIQISKS
jgi:hypothetical protein